jgi:hypothetical protein
MRDCGPSAQPGHEGKGEETGEAIREGQGEGKAAVKNLPGYSNRGANRESGPLLRLIFDFASHTSPSNEAAKSGKKFRKPPGSGSRSRGESGLATT